MDAFRKAKPCLLEPIMSVEIEMPGEFQGSVVGDLNSRRGMILSAEMRGNFAVVQAEVPLASMFGYATVIRGMTKGMGTFSMEMARYGRVPVKIAEEIVFNRRENAKRTA